ncbi:MAG: DUF3795 domain-containing protein [Bacteroidota bacterium]
MIAYCGLNCEGCPIYWATREQYKQKQGEMRVDIARLCREHYGMDVRPEDITDCDGCRSETGRLFSASSKCEIRSCARQRKLDSCAYCADYACEKLQKLFATDASARTQLEAIRTERKNNNDKN